MKIHILITILILQIGIGAYLQMKQPPMGVFQGQTSFLDAKFLDAQEIILEGEGEKTLRIEKKDGNWILPQLWDFPVLTSTMESFFNTWKDMKRSFPVGRTPQAAKQLKTGEDSEWERKLTFKTPEATLATVYLGSSPGFRKVHGRVEGEKETYVLDYNAFDVALDVQDWVNKSYYAYERDSIKELRLGSLHLQQEGASFLTNPRPREGKEIDVTKTADIINKILNPSFTEVLGKDVPKPSHPPTLTYSLLDQQDRERTFSYYLEGDFYILHVSDSPYSFKLRPTALEGLKDLKTEDFWRDVPTPAASTPTEA